MKNFLVLLLYSFAFECYAQFPDLPAHESQKDSEGLTTRIVVQYSDRGSAIYRVHKEEKEQLGGFYDEIEFLDSDRFIVTLANKKGLMNDSGVLIIPVKFDNLVSFRSTGLLAYEQGKCGLYSKNGDMLLSPKKHKILISNNWTTVVENEKKSYDLMLNRKDQLLVSGIQFVEFFDDYAIVKKDDEFAVFTDEMIIPFSNDSISGPANILINKPQRIGQLSIRLSFNSEPFYFNLHESGGQRLFSKFGKEIYSYPLEHIVCYDKHGYCLIKKNGKFGIFFTRTNEKTAFEFDQVSHHLDGFISALIDNKWGVFDKAGKLVVPFEYDEITLNDRKDLMYITKNGLKGLVNIHGELILPVEYDDVETFYIGYNRAVLVTKKSKKGVLDFNGKVIIPVIYEHIHNLGFYAVVTENTSDLKHGLYNQEGLFFATNYKSIDKIISSRVIYLKDFNNRIVLVGDSNKIIAKDVKNFHLIHNEDYLLKGFNGHTNTYISVQNMKGKFGLVNIFTESLAVPFLYDSIVQRFTSKEQKSYFVVQKSKKFGLVDEQNNVIIPIQYDGMNLDLAYKIPGLEITVVAEKNGKFGVVDLNNQTIIPFEYDELKRISHSGLFKAKKNNNLYQIVDLENKPISSDFFDEVSLFVHGGYEKDEYGFLSKSIFKTYTFRNGFMRELVSDGTYLTGPIPMTMHQGFKTFEELKQQLILALNQSDDTALKVFIEKVLPSPYLIFVLKQQESAKQRRLSLDFEKLTNQYYDLLVNFKHNHWHAKDKNKQYDKSLLYETHYLTGFSHDWPGIAKINIDNIFGYQDKTLNLILESCIRVNGFWISSYMGK
jgi:hypothetical protein